MRKVNIGSTGEKHGKAVKKLTYEGYGMYTALERFKSNLKVGDKFVLKNDNDCLGIRSDLAISKMEFTVHRLYRHVVELHHVSPFPGSKHVVRYCPNYATLYVYAKEAGNRIAFRDIFDDGLDGNEIFEPDDPGTVRE